ncbi:hypothetical protein GCM10010214_09280 [Streptomyces abikoensis]|nr:hypothetical protein GCM10010214_09280 [Streptomyces abikoensis]
MLALLHLAEVGGVEDFLETDHLGALRGGGAGVLLVLGDHRLGIAGPGRLDQCRTDNVGHELLLSRGFEQAAYAEDPRVHATVGAVTPRGKTIAHVPRSRQIRQESLQGFLSFFRVAA